MVHSVEKQSRIYTSHAHRQVDCVCAIYIQSRNVPYGFRRSGGGGLGGCGGGCGFGGCPPDGAAAAAAHALGRRLGARATGPSRPPLPPRQRLGRRLKLSQQVSPPPSVPRCGRSGDLRAVGAIGLGDGGRQELAGSPPLPPTHGRVRTPLAARTSHPPVPAPSPPLPPSAPATRRHRRRKAVGSPSPPIDGELLPCPFMDGRVGAPHPMSSPTRNVLKCPSQVRSNARSVPGPNKNRDSTSHPQIPQAHPLDHGDCLCSCLHSRVVPQPSEASYAQKALSQWT